jgi:hypothetical protein
LNDFQQHLCKVGWFMHAVLLLPSPDYAMLLFGGTSPTPALYASCFSNASSCTVKEQQLEQ